MVRRKLRKRPHVSLIILDPDNRARWLAVRVPIMEIMDDTDRAHINMLTRRYVETSVDDETEDIPAACPVRMLTFDGVTRNRSSTASNTAIRQKPKIVDFMPSIVGF